MEADGSAIGAYAEECIKVNPDGVFCAGRDGTVLFANASFADMVKAPVADLLGTDVLRFFPSIDDSGSALAECASRGEVVREEVDLVRCDGFKIPVAVTLSFLPDGDFPEGMAFCFVRDLGESERIARALEDEVLKREDAQRELEEANERLRSLLMTDELTGAASRRFFIKEAERYLSAADSSGRGLSLVILDVDFFKQINDGFGHLAGDRVIEKLVSVIRANMRWSDMIARWGGDEFVVLLPGTGIDGARIMSGRVGKTVEETDFDVGVPVTVSIGIAARHSDDGVDSLIARADRALYAAKRKGRNRCEAIE